MIPTSQLSLAAVMLLLLSAIVNPPRQNLALALQQRHLVDGFEVALPGVLAVSARVESDFCNPLG